MVAPATPVEHELEALYQRTLVQRLRDQRGVAALADAMAALAGDDPRWSARARALQVLGRIYQGGDERVAADLSAALVAFDALDDARGRALASDLNAAFLSNLGDYEGAHALMQSVWSMSEEQRTPLEWCISAGRMATLFERWGRYDEALRWHYRTIAYARDVGDPGYLANAQGAAGGLQLSLNNLEDATVLCDAAWQLVREHGLEGGHAYSLVATNQMMALHFLGRPAEARALAEELETAEPRLVVTNAGKRKMLMAMVFARAAQNGRAHRLLAEGLAAYGTVQAPPLEWSIAKAAVFNEEGRFEDTLAVCHAAEQNLKRLRESALPSDLSLLHAEAVRACEALGDAAGALRAQRSQMAVEREMVGMGTRARRMTLQIQFEVEEMRRERDRLAAHNAALAQADAAKSRFLAAASHDLRQPIHALGLQLAHLRACLTPLAHDDERRATTERMDRALGALTTMFDTLLDISRMDAGVVSPRVNTVALPPLLGRLAEEFAVAARAKGLRLALRVPARAATASDPALLESLLRNLVSNAVKYTQRGGVLIALRPHGTRWALQVWDTGPGIAEDDRQRVFEEFHQLDNPARDRARGLGLGLAIARRLSVLLDHPLQLRSRVGRGSCFAVALPRATADAETAAPPAAESASRALRVAVIEDDVEVRDSLAALLRRWGHHVLAGADADAVLAAAGARTAALDAVIADFRLGDAARTGDVQARQVQAALGPRAAVLIVSGDTAPERLRALSTSGLSWLSKPVQAARLRSWLNSVSCSQ
jgi:signal transduction histidine kinase